MVVRRLTITGFGPVTRLTVGGTGQDQRFEATNDALHWIWSWHLQVERLRSSTEAEGRGSSDTERRQSYSKATYDEHLLAVAGANLARALAGLGDQIADLSWGANHVRALRLLRNLYEHWDEQRPSFQEPGSTKSGSGKEFMTHFPDGQPWSITYGPDDWLLGGVVPIQALTDALPLIEARVLELEQKYRTESLPQA